MTKDEVFRQSLPAIEDFNFGEKVASVFDDMLTRSVPFYTEMQRMIGEMAQDLAVDGSKVYDLGCSTGTTLIHLEQLLRGREIDYVGIDYSEEMLAKCRNKMAEHGFAGSVELACADLNQGIYVENASLVLMVLTLQFIRPLHRDKLIRAIYDGMRENGALILVEKVLGEDSLFNRSFIKYYYEFKKKNGYSELEISQKREALENVLIPYRLKENLEMLEHVGFNCVDVFFKWYNFTGIIAVKR